MAWSDKFSFLSGKGRNLMLEEIGQGVVNRDQNAIRVEVTTPTTLTASTAAAIAAVDAAPDRVETPSYYDAGTVNERYSTIVTSSASLGLSYTETFTYAGSPGAYRIATITRS